MPLPFSVLFCVLFFLELAPSVAVYIALSHNRHPLYIFEHSICLLLKIISIIVFYGISSLFIHIQETKKRKTEESHFISANAFKFNRLMLLYEVLLLMIADYNLVFLFFFQNITKQV